MKKKLLVLLLLFFAFQIKAQNDPNDCVNAIIVCGNGTFASNASGVGNTQEISACGGFESNSLWIEINIVQGGTLGFDLIPDDPNIAVDYDFWVYGPNVACGALGSPIRCCTTNPIQAATPDNHTGMYGSTTQTQVGPGNLANTNGEAYVRWLTVSPGQSYYIAIDRPTGNGGFQIQWTGTAMNGTGAFTTPPTANSIPDQLTCSSTPNVGIFDLDVISPLINANTTANTITYHNSLAEAFDNSNALPNIYANISNPETIFVRVTDNVSGCNSITQFNLVVATIPVAAISVSSNTVCEGSAVTVTFTGTPNAIIEYNINSGATQTATIGASGTFSFIDNPTIATTYNLTNVKMNDAGGNTICTTPIIDSESVSVVALPTATISGTASICSGSTATIDFSGTPNASVIYTVNSGPNQTINLDGAGLAIIVSPALTANTTYSLVSVSSSGIPTCSQTQSGSAVITIVALPTATISGTATICSGATATITFTGTPNATVTYTVNSGPNQTIILNAAGTASLTTPALTANTTYDLVSVTSAGTPSCSQTQSGSATLTIAPLPTATISGTTSICSGATATVSFNGTPNATVTYTVNSGPNQTIPLNVAGTASLTTPTLTANTTYSLVSVASSGTPSCSQTQSGSAVISILSLPTATISGTTSICSGATATVSFNGTPNATVTYTVNSGPNQTIVLNATGTASITTPALTANSTYALVSVTSSGAPTCSQTQSGSAVITIVSLPTATISGTATICSGSTATITFGGTPNATVTYTVNSGPNQTIVLNVAGTANLITPALTANTTYSLVSVAITGPSGCSQTQSGSAILTIAPLPTATISGTASICSGTTATVSFNGTPNATVTYTVNSGPNQTIVLNAAGTASLTTSALTANTTYSLVSVASSGAPSCSQTQSGSAVITIISLPTATISGTTSICSGATATISFNGTPNATVTYTVNSGPNQTIVLNATGTASITTPALTANSTYALVSVTSSGTPTCSQTQSGSAVITIVSLPTATISGTTSICSGSTATISFNGTPNATVTYTVNSGSNQTIVLNATGNASITTPALTTTTTYDLVSVTSSGAPTCSQIQSGSAVISVISLPTVTISGSSSVCSGSTTTVFFNGTPNATVTYTVNSGSNQTIVLNATGNASITTPALTTTTTYDLVGAATSGTPTCTQSQVGNLTITINPVPTATIAASSPSVCMNYPSPTVTFTGFSGTSPYTFTYTINAGIPNTTPQSSPTHVINVPTNTVGPFTYELVSVTDANGCTQAINQSVTVTVLTAPIINTPIAYELCDDDSNDGIACFDLTGVVAPQVTTNPTLIVTFHETLTDSQTGAYPQVSPYCNINNLNNQTLYIRVFDPNAPQCYALTTVQLIVHPKPIAVEPTPLHECDDNYDGFTVFNLTDKTAEILGSINPVTHSIHYYESLADAQVPQNAIGLPTSYTNIVANTQTIWVRVETLSTGCFDIVELQLVVDPLPLVNQPACTAYTVCETAAPIGFEQFNLQTKVDCILQGQLGMSVTFYPSLLNAQNNTNVISNLLYTNIVAYVQTLGIRVTNMTTGCYVISTMDIRVEPLPVPIAPLSAYEVCDTDQNGIYEFDLTTLSAGILGANPSGNVISYHETQTDAQMGTNAISLTQPYLNIIPYMQTLWVNVTNPATGCYGIIPIQIKVNESPRMPDLNDLVYCDEDSNNQNGITSINLAQQTPLILAAQTILPISNYTVTYYTSLLDAQQQVNNIINTTTFTGTNQTIWVVVEHNITGCTKIGEFDIIVNIPLALTPPPALSVCDDDSQPNNTYTTFDLTIREAVITQGLPGYTVTYYPSYANALAHTNAILNPTAYINTQAAVQTLGIMVTSPAGCRSYTTMDIRVLPVPTPNRTNIPILAPQCEDAVGSGQQFFNLTVNQTYILNNDPNVTAHYFHTLADATAVPPVNEILNPANAYIGDSSIAGQVPRPVNYVQNIYIAVTSNLFTEYTGQNCYVIVEQPFIINPLPIVKVIGEQQICEEDPLGNDGIEVFDLTSYNSDLLSLNNTTPASSYTVNFYTDLGYTNLITNPTSYSNVTNPQTIYVSITATDTYVDPVTGITHTTSCTSRDKFDIRVNPKPTITQPANPLATCDVNDSQNDGYDENYDLSSLVTEILNGQDPTQFTVTFYDSEYNPDATPPLVPTPLNVASYDVYTHTYWAAVTNNATGCFKTTSFNIVVEETPEPFIKNDPQLNVICVDYNTHQVVRPLLLETENLAIPYLVNQPNYTYEWFEDGVAIANSNSSTLLIDFALNDNTSSIFTVVMTSDTALGCSDVSQNYLVIQSGQATPITGTIGYTVTNAFTDNQIITVTVDGYGTYQYSLDDGPRQDSPVFEYVSLGEHIITVWDTEGGIENSCDPLIIENVQTIDYPLYFTPNGDGVHETWNIVGLGGQPDAKIYIFDRHGKLIKQISSAGAGWDGTYNGQQMPSTDYWFTVDYREQETVKQFKAHFSLKR